MKRIVLSLLFLTLFSTSCVSKKKFVDLETKNKEIQRAKRALKMVSYKNTSKIINLDSGKKERKLSLKQ